MSDEQKKPKVTLIKHKKPVASAAKDETEKKKILKASRFFPVLSKRCRRPHP